MNNTNFASLAAMLRITFLTGKRDGRMAAGVVILACTRMVRASVEFVIELLGRPAVVPIRISDDNDINLQHQYAQQKSNRRRIL